jgi:acetoin utilization protein AcuB
MSNNPVTVSPETTVPDALTLMEKIGIRRLPVVDKDRLVGIVTLLDLVRASPSQATSLSIWEMNYLLAKLPVRDVMAKTVLTVSPETPIDEAAKLMREHRLGGLPVVSEGKLAGIITETDIFTAFLDMLGVNRGGLRLTLELPDRQGSLAEVAEVFRNLSLNVVSVTVLPSEPGKNVGLSVWRLQGSINTGTLLDVLREKGFDVIHTSENGNGQK